MTLEHGTTSVTDITRWKGMSQNIVNAIARDFVDGSVVLVDTPAVLGSQYQFFEDKVSIRTIDEQDNRSFLIGLPVADFVGGVAFALASEGIIDQQSADPTNVARVCFALGKISAQTSQNGAMNG